MAVTTSTIDLPIVPPARVTPRYRRGRPRTWRVRAYEVATDTARELAWAITVCAIVEVVVLVLVGLLVRGAGAALAVAGIIGALTVVGILVRRAAS